MNTETGSFAQRLKLAMALRGTNATSLAYGLGVSKASVSEWLGGGGVSLQSLAAIAIELNVSIDWLWLGRGNINLFGTLSPSEEEAELLTELRQAGPATQAALTDLLSALASQLYGNDAVQQILALDMLKEAGTALCIVSHDGILLDLNDACLALLGDQLDKETDAIGTHFSEWLGEEDTRRAQAHLAKGIQQRHSTHFSCRIHRKATDDSKRCCDVVMNAIFCGDAQHGHFQCMLFQLD